MAELGLCQAAVTGKIVKRWFPPQKPLLNENQLGYLEHKWADSSLWVHLSVVGLSRQVWLILFYFWANPTRVQNQFSKPTGGRIQSPDLFRSAPLRFPPLNSFHKGGSTDAGDYYSLLF